MTSKGHGKKCSDLNIPLNNNIHAALLVAHKSRVVLWHSICLCGVINITITQIIGRGEITICAAEGKHRNGEVVLLAQPSSTTGRGTAVKNVNSHVNSESMRHE